MRVPDRDRFVRRSPMLLAILAAGTSLLWFLPLEGSSAAKIRQQAASSPSERLQRIVERLRVERDLPGISVAIVQRDGAMVVAASGFADRRSNAPVTPATRFFIGSISKNLFATIALRLVDQGRLRLDAPLSTFVDWPRGDRITVKMLLNHTAGIPEYLTDARLQPPPEGGVPVFFRSPQTPRRILEAVRLEAPAFEPGSRQEYSNTNALLVGEIIQRVTGQRLAAAFATWLANPAGLRNMYLYGGATPDGLRARGYSRETRWGGTGQSFADCSAADEALPDSADGSVVAGAADLLRYHQTLRQGGLLSPTSWAAMRRVDPGLSNGLSYLLGRGAFGPYEGSVGRAMGSVAASLYYPDHALYVVAMVNRGDAAIPLEPLLKEWLASGK